MELVEFLNRVTIGPNGLFLFHTTPVENDQSMTLPEAIRDLRPWQRRDGHLLDPWKTADLGLCFLLGCYKKTRHQSSCLCVEHGGPWTEQDEVLYQAHQAEMRRFFMPEPQDPADFWKGVNRQ